jgi:predicted metal-dependent hydrolase
MASNIELDGIAIEVIRKGIKYAYLRIHPATGRARISAPKRMSSNMIREFATSNLEWIRHEQAKFAVQHQAERRMVSGESHDVQGERYRLEVVEVEGRTSVALRNGDTLELRVSAGTGRREREAALDRWYRELLRAQIPVLLAAWEPIVGVKVVEWRIRKMKTRWGSCNISDRRICLNLELITKPRSCLEYIVVHELVHILERHHNDQFKKYMDRFLPDWRVRKSELESAPSSAETGMV